MDIRQLRFLTALAQEQHFARAADAAGITQPTLSARIKQLEQELGVTIVERGHRFKGFTPEGERVLGWARRILADCDALSEELTQLKGQLSGTLELGVIPSALSMTAGWTTPLRRLHPGVRLRIYSMSSRQIAKGLDSLNLHAGVTYLDNEEVGPFRSRALCTENYALVSAHAETSEPISWAEAAGLPLCLMTREMQFRRIVDAAFARAGVEPVPAVETNSVAALLAHVLRGELVSVLTDKQLESLNLQSSLAVRRLVQPAVSHELGLVAVNRAPMPMLTQALWDALGQLIAKNLNSPPANLPAI